MSSIVPIFVSSTWLDLQPEREAVETALQRLRETKFVGMEYFGSRDETTRQTSLDEVDRSRVYVGIIGGRYGSGITEAEYRRALALNLPCFIYFKRDADIAAEWRESDPAKVARLTAFRTDLQSRHIVTEFSSPEDLAARLTADLHHWLVKEYLNPRLADAAQGRMPREEARGMLDAIRDESGLDPALLASARQVVINQVAGDVVYGEKHETVIHTRPVALALVAVALIVAIAAYFYFSRDRGDGIYRVRTTVVNPQGTPIEEARVWSSIGGEPKKVAGGWQFDIPAASKPQDGKLTIFATQENAFLKGQAELILREDFNPTITVNLIRDASAKVRGQVMDSRGRAVAGARVFVTGYEGEAVVTSLGGNFELPAHAAENQQVLVVAEKAGAGVVRLWHPAGDTPLQLVLQR